MSDFSIKWAAFKILVKSLGLVPAIAVGLRLEMRTRMGHPFRALPGTKDSQELASRQQLGPAVVLFSLLKARYDTQFALRVTGKVIEAGAHVFLRSSVGRLDKDALALLNPDQRRGYLQDRLDKFPNALFRIDDVSAERVQFTVTRCYFVRLCHALDVPELAPLFCAGDASYFGGVQPGVRLIRPETIAQGSSSCPFTLEWTENQTTVD